MIAMPGESQPRVDTQRLFQWHYWVSVAELVCQEENWHGGYIYELHNLRWHCIEQANALFPKRFYLILQMDILPNVGNQKGDCNEQ